jgi:hypothetical protein
MAEEVGFEPTRLSPNGFQDRLLKPLGHSSVVFIHSALFILTQPYGECQSKPVSFGLAELRKFTCSDRACYNFDKGLRGRRGVCGEARVRERERRGRKRP